MERENPEKYKDHVSIINNKRMEREDPKKYKVMSTRSTNIKKNDDWFEEEKCKGKDRFKRKR